MNGSAEAGSSSSAPPPVNPSRTHSDSAQVYSNSQPPQSGPRRGNSDGQTARAGTIIGRQHGPYNAEREDGETWHDFLRRAPPQDIVALPPDDPTRQAYFRDRKVRVAEEARKRRRAVSNTLHRNPPPPPVPSRQHSASLSLHRSQPLQPYPGQQNHSRSHHPSMSVDRPLPRLPSFDAPHNSPGTLPRWQLDSEVDACPICGRAFGMFFRRHHCRKCGRVVCAGCSPHRITIPRQFIVHPPQDLNLSRAIRTETGIDVVDLTSEEGGETTPAPALNDRNPALGGGQEVRLCNPCVPDPNPNPLQFQSYHANNPLGGITSFSHLEQSPATTHNSRLRQYNVSDPLPSYPPYGSQASVHNGPGAAGPFNSNSFPLPPGHSVRSPYGSAPTAGSYFPPQSTSWAPHRGTQGHAYPTSSHRSHHRPHASTSSYLQRLPSLQSQAPLPPTPPPPPPPVREEDECPICHEELPAKGSDGDETAREAHIVACIDSHSSASAPRPAATSHSATGDRNVRTSVAASSARPTGEMSSSAGMAATGRPSIAATPESSTTQRQRRKTNCMLVYNASEKDCVGEDGIQQECVVCLEDFQVGDEMGRLECLCKFHKKCIRDWWDRKGAGSCPVHQDGI